MYSQRQTPCLDRKMLLFGAVLSGIVVLCLLLVMIAPVR